MIRAMLPQSVVSAVIDPGKTTTGKVLVLGPRGGGADRKRPPGRPPRIGPSPPQKRRGMHYKADPSVVGKDGVQVCISMPAEDFAQFCELARRLKVSRSQLVRDLVRARHAQETWKP